MDKLFETILALSSLDECYAFFEDLCTVSELHDMQQRFHVAEMLHNGTVFTEIVSETGASTATISRVNRSLQHGQDGYKRMLSRLNP